MFTFPADLTALTDQDVANIDAYFANANIPSDFVTTGMPWSDVLRQVAQIFLLAQSVSGSTGTAIFTSGTTLDSTVVGTQQSQSAGHISGGTTQQASALAQVIGGQAGVFDLSSVDPSSSVSDVLISTSQQFTAPIILGNGVI